MEKIQEVKRGRPQSAKTNFKNVVTRKKSIPYNTENVTQSEYSTNQDLR